MTPPATTTAAVPGPLAPFERVTVHMLSLAELPGAYEPPGPQGVPGHSEGDADVSRLLGPFPHLTAADLRHVRTYTGGHRRLSAAAARGLLRSALGRALGVRPRDVPLNDGTPGRTAVGGRELTYSVSHDQGTVVVAHHPHGCGVDVEDHQESLFVSLAHRFCAGGAAARAREEAAARVPTFRALWTAKESVAKAMGRGLAAGLSTLTLEALPGSNWSLALQHGVSTGHLVHTTVFGDRALSVAVRTATPPGLSLVHWSAARGSLEPVTTPGPPEAPGAPEPQDTPGPALPRRQCVPPG